MGKRETHEWYASKIGFLCHHCGATATEETMAEINRQDCVWPFVQTESDRDERGYVKITYVKKRRNNDICISYEIDGEFFGITLSPETIIENYLVAQTNSIG